MIWGQVEEGGVGGAETDGREAGCGEEGAAEAVRNPGYAGVSAEDVVLNEGVEGAEGEEEGAAEGSGAVGAAGYQVRGLFLGGLRRGRHGCD